MFRGVLLMIRGESTPRQDCARDATPHGAGGAGAREWLNIQYCHHPPPPSSSEH